MGNITITQDNLSKFTKRLHKALSEHHASHSTSPNLSQSSEIFAKALGAVNLYELQTLLGIPPVSFEEQWVNTIEQTIRDYLKSTPQTKLNGDEIQWRRNTAGTYLSLYNHEENGKSNDEGLFIWFNENCKDSDHQVENLKQYAHVEFYLPACDVALFEKLANSFPTDILERIKITQFLKANRGLEVKRGKPIIYVIAPQPHPPLPVPSSSTPEQQWVENTERAICTHLNAHPNSKLNDASWSSSKFPNMFLK